MHDTCDGITRDRRPGFLLAPLIVIFAGIHLYCPPVRVAELEVIPDSVEYSVAAHRFATRGRYEIQIDGRALPPRYPPGFSVLFLAPIYAMAPGQIGNGIFAVWLAGMMAALFAYLLGNKIAGPWGGVLAAVLLLQNNQFLNYTQVIMTDIPAVALGLIACWVYLRVREGGTAVTWVLAGVVVALSVAIRPMTGVLMFPFLACLVGSKVPPVPSPAVAGRPNPPVRAPAARMLRRLAGLTLPTLIVVSATSLHQRHAFGDWRRTGYQFWLPVPYDYFSLTFSARYLRDNLRLFQWTSAWAPLLAGAFGLIALWIKRRSSASPVTHFLLLAAAPLSLIHVFYFFTDIRFHFMLLAICCVLAGAGTAALIPEKIRRTRWLLLPVLALGIFIPRISHHPLEEGPAIRYEVATKAAELLPTNAVLISGVDPCYMEQMFARGTSRRVVPIGRGTPYATSVVARSRIAQLNPPPRNAADQSCAGLLRGGAEWLYSSTADEEIGLLHRQIREGIPVYAELLSTTSQDHGRAMLERAFRLAPVSKETPWLVRLALLD